MKNRNTVHEPSRDVPVAGEYDVIIIGGGIAGVTAALAAARNGAQVCLVERYCGLGGLATLGNVTIWLPLCDGKGTQVISGLGEELLKLSVADLQKDNPAARFKGIPVCWQQDGNTENRIKNRYQVDFNPSSYMLALEKLVADSGVKLLYDTRFCTVRRTGTCITHVIIENKSGRSALSCRTVVDATGDADVCASAGERTVSQNSNVLSGWFYTLTDGELKLHSLSNQYDPYAETDNAKGPFFRGDDADQVTDHILQTRTKVRDRIAELRTKYTTSDPQLLMPAMTACFRMTRRLVGSFELGEKHVHQWFDNTIGLTGDWRKPGPVYAIPFDCLRGVQNSNLVVAGRCISVDSTAWDVLRVIPPCVVTGEAAGTAAALASSKTGGDINALDYCVLKDRLLAQDVLLDSELVVSHSDSQDQTGKT